jgi:hypothetical protein
LLAISGFSFTYHSVAQSINQSSQSIKTAKAKNSHMEDT